MKWIALAIPVFAAVSVVHAEEPAPDQDLVQKLLVDPSALATALSHCDPAAITADPECVAALAARNRQFFGDGSVPYTPQKVDIFPHTPDQLPVSRPSQK